MDLRQINNIGLGDTAIIRKANGQVKGYYEGRVILITRKGIEVYGQEGSVFAKWCNVVNSTKMHFGYTPISEEKMNKVLDMIIERNKKSNKCINTEL